MDAVTMATKEDAAGSLSCFSCAVAVVTATVVSAVSEMDAAIAAAVPLSGYYLSCAAVETASNSTPPSGQKL